MEIWGNSGFGASPDHQPISFENLLLILRRVHFKAIYQRVLWCSGLRVWSLKSLAAEYLSPTKVNR